MQTKPLVANDDGEAELSERLAQSPSHGEAPTSLKRVRNLYRTLGREAASSEDDEEDLFPEGESQWISSDGSTFQAIGEFEKYEKLPPGVYTIIPTQSGLIYKKVSAKTEDLLRFPDSVSDKVVAEIQKFWGKEETFKEFGLSYKRGCILWGAPGGGKTCTLQIIMEDVIKRDGVVFLFEEPEVFAGGFRIFRKIQPDTPVVVAMEDLDDILDSHGESRILNILDGIENLHKVVFLATTNYPEKLGARIINRPSRFDKRYKIGYPSAEARKMYLEHLIKGRSVEDLKIDLDTWIKDTENFSIAHLKELFIDCVILGNPYDKAIKTLIRMREQVFSDKEFQDKGFGFKINSAEDDEFVPTEFEGDEEWEDD